MYSKLNSKSCKNTKCRRIQPVRNNYNSNACLRLTEDTNYQVFTTISYSNTSYEQIQTPILIAHNNSTVNPGAIRFRQSLRKNEDYKKKLYSKSVDSVNSSGLRTHSPVLGAELKEDPFIVVNRKRPNCLPPLHNCNQFPLVNYKSLERLLKPNYSRKL